MSVFFKKSVSASGVSLRVLLFSLLIAAAVTWWFDPRVEQAGFSQAQVEDDLRETLTPEYLQQQVEQALLLDDLELARDYLSLAERLELPVDVALQARLNEQEGFFADGYRTSKAFGRGFLFGEGDSSAALVGSVSADFTVVGDVRDLSIEASHYLHDEPVDQLLAALSAVGIALTAGTVLSLGAAAEVTVPSKVALSLLKFGKKSGRLSKGFLSSLRTWARQSVDLEPIFKRSAAIKGTDYFKSAVWRELAVVSKRSVKLKKVDAVVQPLTVIQKQSGSMANTLKVLKYADSTADLNRLSRLTKAFGKHSVVVLKTLGKGALKISRRAWKWFLALFGLVMGGVYSLVTFGGAYFFKRRVLG